MDIARFMARLCEIRLVNVFNPYRDRCGEFDGKNSAAIRAMNFELYLSTALQRGVDSVWLGRDCGYRGGRRTGIALTDEFHLGVLRERYGIGGIAKATTGAPVKERTATEIWRMVNEISERVFLWNVFPFHPHEPSSAMSNRRHSAKEFAQCQDLLVTLIEALRPTRLIALGLDAYREVSGLGYAAIAVRHPSYGGHRQFASGIREIYQVPSLF